MKKMWSRSWSAGLGIQGEKFYIDLPDFAGRHGKVYPYATSTAPEILVSTEQVQGPVHDDP